MNNNKPNPLLETYFQRDISKLKVALAGGSSVDSEDADGWTILFHAVRDGENAFVQELLDHGANVNVADHNLRTPLHLAAQGYHVDTARLLLRSGAVVDVQDIHGNTPLWRATFESRGRPEMIRLLIDAGADRLAKNKYGVSPSDLAETIGNFDVRAVLRLS